MTSPTITFDPVADFDGVHTFDVTGTTQGIAPKSQLYLYASPTMDPNISGEITTALVQLDGTFDFKDDIPTGQNFIYGTYYDIKSKQRYFGEPSFSLDNARHFEDVYSPTDGTFQYEATFSRDSGTTVDVASSGESVPSFTSDTFENHREPDNTFVFSPGHGADVVDQFKLTGGGHDTLSFSGSDFGNDMANVLAHTFNEKGGAVIVDPVTYDTVKISGLFKKQIEVNPGDIAFHA